MTETVLDAAIDLLLGGSCVGCGRPGRLLCRACQQELPSGAVPAWPSPPPAGLVEPWAAASYDGTVRAMVIGLKERRLLGLASPLARLLATAAACALDGQGPGLLVPVPSRPSSLRARGHDPTHTITARAARRLRRDGLDVTEARLLRVRRGVADQAGLDAEQRAANLHGAMVLRAAASRPSALPPQAVRVVVCDDVLTTGSTAREAQRALQAGGFDVVGVAAVASTQRRSAATG